jgi:hypothetical protein
MSQFKNVIPETTPLRYLSGLAALNIPSENGTGDWHMVETFMKPKTESARLFVAGVGCADDTTPLLSSEGVFDCSKVLDRFKIPHPKGAVFAANHARAIADMVIVTVLGGGSPNFIALDDWMPGVDDKGAVFSMLQLVFEKIEKTDKESIVQWITKNSN